MPIQYLSNGAFSRSLPALRFQEDDTLVVSTPKDWAVALLEGKAVPLLDAEAAAALDQDEEAVVDLFTKTESLRPLTFEDDIKKLRDGKFASSHCCHVFEIHVYIRVVTSS